MLFYVQMRWNYQGRISQDQLWDMETLEGIHALEGIKAGFVKLYKVVSQHRIIAIVETDSLDDLDRNSMWWLPMREFLEFEEVWALRDYEGFIEDVKAKFPPANASGAPTLDTSRTAAEAMTKAVTDRWFGALKKGDGPGALDCLDDNVLWINGPGEKRLSDIIPWLGEYHGRAAVEQSFVVWGQLSQVKQFEVRGLLIEGDEALAIVHEVATIKATGLDYDIEFIQRLRVAGKKIVFWKSYWDTVKGIIPFRGDLRARLIEAAMHSSKEQAMLLLPYGADPNTTDETTGQTVLMMAAARGALDMAETLLQFGADPNIADRRAGATALHKACQGGNLPIVQALVSGGAWINQQVTTTGHTPLVEAIWFKSDEIVAYLLNKNAILGLKTYYGFTIDQHIDYAIRVSQSAADQRALGRIKDLVQQRRNRDDKRAQTCTLIKAVLDKDVNAFKAGLQAGADIEERYPFVGSFEDGHTPLLVAARDGQTDIVRELVAAGADVNAIEPVFGAVPLHKATYNGNADITRLLVASAEIRLNYQGPSNGYTPLHDALWHGYAECAQILIEAGARTDIVAFDGKKPLDLAVQKLGESNPVVALLRSKTSPGTAASR